MNILETCDLCGHEIIASLTKSSTEFYNIDASGALTGPIPVCHQFPSTLDAESTIYRCSNPDCGQVIGDREDLKFYMGHSDPDEFRLFKQLDQLQDVIEELCRMQLDTDSLNASVVIRNTLKDLPEKLPIIIEMKRKMVEGDYVDKIDMGKLFSNL